MKLHLPGKRAKCGGEKLILIKSKYLKSCIWSMVAFFVFVPKSSAQIKKTLS